MHEVICSWVSGWWFQKWQNSCFYGDKKTSDRSKRLENQMKLSSTCELNEDPFTHTEEDIIAAAPSFTNIDENDNEDVNIED